MREIRWKTLRAIAKSIQNGTTITAACEAAKVARVTVWRWRKSDERINKFIQALMDSQIQSVEDALFKRAVGYRYDEETKEVELGDSEKKTKRVVTKEVVPDATACMFFLMNRAPDRWADKRALVNNYNVIKNTVNPLNGYKDEELDGIIYGFVRRPEITQS